MPQAPPHFSIGPRDASGTPNLVIPFHIEDINPVPRHAERSCQPRSDTLGLRNFAKPAHKYGVQTAKLKMTAKTVYRPLGLNGCHPAKVIIRSNIWGQRKNASQPLVKGPVELQGICLFPMDGFDVPHWADSAFRTPAKIDVGI